VERLFVLLDTTADAVSLLRIEHEATLIATVRFTTPTPSCERPRHSMQVGIVMGSKFVARHLAHLTAAPAEANRPVFGLSAITITRRTLRAKLGSGVYVIGCTAGSDCVLWDAKTCSCVATFGLAIGRVTALQVDHQNQR
jgi:hypothetical protein